MPNKSNKKSSKESNKITIVVLGEGGVGKSSMTLNYIRNEFSESYDPTIDDSYLTTVVLDGMEWLIEVIDTAGQEEYRGLWVEHALSQGDAFIIVYAINSESSLRILPSFLQSISQNKNFDNLKSSGSSHGMQAVAEDKSDNLSMKRCPFPFAVAGNKSDLESNRAVTTQDGSRLASLTGGLFYECSAKADVNVKEVFNELIRATIRLRRLRAAHKKNPKTSNRPFIANIAYNNLLSDKDSTPHTLGSSPSAPSPSHSGNVDSWGVMPQSSSMKSHFTQPPFQAECLSPKSFKAPQDWNQIDNNDFSNFKAKPVNVIQPDISTEDGRFKFPAPTHRNQECSKSHEGCSCLVT